MGIAELEMVVGSRRWTSGLRGVSCRAPLFPLALCVLFCLAGTNGEAEAQDSGAGVSAVTALFDKDAPVATQDSPNSQAAQAKALAEKLRAKLEKEEKANSEEKAKEAAEKKKVNAETIAVAAATNKESDQMIQGTKSLLAPNGAVADAAAKRQEAEKHVAAANRKIEEIKLNAGLVVTAKNEAQAATAEAEAAA